MNPTPHHDGHAKKEGQYIEKRHGKKRGDEEESESGRAREFSPPSEKPEIDPSLYGRNNEESADQPSIFGNDPNVNQPATGS